PEARLIALLRDPVTRAYSHYQLAARDGHETLAFEEALRREGARLAGEEQRLAADPAYRSDAHRHHSYLARGAYAEQLRRWRLHFPSEQLLVVASEELFADPEGAIIPILDFLGLPHTDLPPLPARNQRPYAPMSPEARGILEA